MTRSEISRLGGLAKHAKHPQGGINSPNYKHGLRCNDRQIKEIHAIRSMIQVAIENGSLKKEPCEVCKSSKVLSHHDDYSKPLDVRWLCRKDHGKWHKNNESPVKIFMER